MSNTESNPTDTSNDSQMTDAVDEMPEGDDDSPLDDYFSVAWLSALGLIMLSGIVFSGYLVASGRIAVNIQLTGTIDIGQIISATLVPLFWLVTILSVIELWGKQKVKALLNGWGGSR